MEVKLNVYINDSEINIDFDNNKSTIIISNESNLNTKVSKQNLYFLLKEGKVIYIGQINDNNFKIDNKFDKIINLSVPHEVNLEFLKYIFIKEAMENKIDLINEHNLFESEISENQNNITEEYKDKILFIFKNFGYDIFNLNNNSKRSDKSFPAKTRHKWSKEISKIIFTAKSKDGEGKAIWKSKDELMLLAGAKLVVDPQLNKDGTINYSAQFAQKLRSDYSDKIIDNVTTEDIVFQSPNQLGMFLFYGGQNTWVELKDNDGKTLDEWSRLE